MISIKTKISLVVIFIATICPVAFANTLYERLGGEKIVAQFVSETVDLSIVDPLIKRSFDKVDLKKLKVKVA